MSLRWLLVTVDHVTYVLSEAVVLCFFHWSLLYWIFVDSKSAIFCVVHGIVVDHEIPDEGMSHVLWQCYIIC